MFICNHCPYVKAVEDRLLALARELQPAGARFLAICANDPTDHPEDTPEQLRQRWREKHYPFPYLIDDTQDVARRFGADRTCPLMTGIFVKILAGAVAEDLVQGHKPRWPVWRLVSDNGAISTTWPLDDLYRATRLREEGVRLGHRAGAWLALNPGSAPA